MLTRCLDLRIEQHQKLERAYELRARAQKFFHHHEPPIFNLGSLCYDMKCERCKLLAEAVRLERSA